MRAPPCGYVKKIVDFIGLGWRPERVRDQGGGVLQEDRPPGQGQFIESQEVLHPVLRQISQLLRSLFRPPPGQVQARFHRGSRAAPPRRPLAQNPPPRFTLHRVQGAEESPQLVHARRRQGDDPRRDVIEGRHDAARAHPTVRGLVREVAGGGGPGAGAEGCGNEGAEEGGAGAHTGGVQEGGEDFGQGEFP